MGALHSTEKLQAAKLRASLLRGDISDTLKIIDENPRLYTIALDDESGQRALHLAVQHGFHDFLLITSKYCTQGVYCPVSHFDGSGAAGRAMPAIQRHAQTALDRGRGHDGVTPLMLACDLGDQEAARLFKQM
ncbi:hypothetical protein CEUSTIGMA_g4726.t1 [Chlamydomonas eustigma]|uniref:Uncharacterized protein n=1 Tax=Chlamydomonas eustigma TaxID=1157962 RepID=A0A250X3D3_9CHLO|nr:hypothetical protein CEUSTIGMA_g4726.t1 [Chlamydomonas eustigma]|eukprot:GAX77280.1 hypothetical protein CEUSTIGMA_g4726.t1 [Chlamydomonas eustigma]